MQNFLTEKLWLYVFFCLVWDLMLKSSENKLEETSSEIPTHHKLYTGLVLFRFTVLWEANPQFSCTPYLQWQRFILFFSILPGLTSSVSSSCIITSDFWTWNHNNCLINLGTGPRSLMLFKTRVRWILVNLP